MATDGRRERGLKQRIHLLRRVEEDDHHVFHVCGETGREYAVVCHPVLQERPWSCNCPDHKYRSTTCKHIYFIAYRVLGCTAGVENGISSSPEALTIALTRSSTAQLEPRNRDEACPICFEEMDNAEDTNVCITCTNMCHTQCIQTWSNASRRLPACPMCRSPVVLRDGGGGRV